MNKITTEFHRASFEEILDYVGKSFSCERIFIFEKNERGTYDCTTEWCQDPQDSKKESMQNFSRETVKYYYHYFNRKENLILRDIEELREADPQLYLVLALQNLKSTMVAQLVFEGRDLGFIGIDNPAQEKFDDLAVVLELVAYLVAKNIEERN